jgi:primosomal protein N'
LKNITKDPKIAIPDELKKYVTELNESTAWEQVQEEFKKNMYWNKGHIKWIRGIFGNNKQPSVNIKLLDILGGTEFTELFRRDSAAVVFQRMQRRNISQDALVKMKESAKRLWAVMERKKKEKIAQEKIEQLKDFITKSPKTIPLKLKEHIEWLMTNYPMENDSTFLMKWPKIQREFFHCMIFDSKDGTWRWPEWFQNYKELCISTPQTESWEDHAVDLSAVDADLLEILDRSELEVLYGQYKDSQDKIRYINPDENNDPDAANKFKRFKDRGVVVFDYDFLKNDYRLSVKADTGSGKGQYIKWFLNVSRGDVPDLPLQTVDAEEWGYVKCWMFIFKFLEKQNDNWFWRHSEVAITRGRLLATKAELSREEVRALQPVIDKADETTAWNEWSENPSSLDSTPQSTTQKRIRNRNHADDSDEEMYPWKPSTGKVTYKEYIDGTWVTKSGGEATLAWQRASKKKGAADE